MAEHTELSPKDRVIAAHELGHAIVLYCYDNFHHVLYPPNGQHVGARNGVAKTQPKKKFDQSSSEEHYLVAMAGPKAGLKYAQKYHLPESTNAELEDDFVKVRNALKALGLDDTRLEHAELDPMIESLLDRYWTLIEHLIPKLINDWYVWESDVREGIEALNLPSR
jgi:hypothetical protein